MDAAAVLTHHLPVPGPVLVEEERAEAPRLLLCLPGVNLHHQVLLPAVPHGPDVSSSRANLLLPPLEREMPKQTHGQWRQSIPCGVLFSSEHSFLLKKLVPKGLA